MAKDIGHEHEALPTSNERTITILGCGALGTAILSGLLASMTDSTAGMSKISFTRFVACVRRKDTATAIWHKLGANVDVARVEVFNNQNIRGVNSANTIILACQPHLYTALLDEPGMRQALQGKLIISVLAGVTTAQLDSALGDGGCHSVVRTMPNIACFVRDSTTLIENPVRKIPESLLRIVDTVFRCLGSVFFIDPPVFDICTALCGSVPAFIAVFIESMVDGAVTVGLNHDIALDMAAHTLRGTASLLLENRNPWQVRHQVASPGGSTIQGLLTLEQGRVRATIANAIIVASKEAKKLGTNKEKS